MLAAMTGNGLCKPLKAVGTKYMIAHGVMLNIENGFILSNLVSEIDLDFDALMIECVLLCDNDLLPVTQYTD